MSGSLSRLDLHSQPESALRLDFAVFISAQVQHSFGCPVSTDSHIGSEGLSVPQSLSPLEVYFLEHDQEALKSFFDMTDKQLIAKHGLYISR